MPETPKQTVIEDGTEFQGSIKSQCGITLSGKLQGELQAPSLLVTPSGAVSGQVRVSQLKSQGEIAGEIEAESVELAGRVSDQTVIRAATLEVKLSQASGGIQVTFGNCELQVGGKVAKGGAESGRAAASQAKPDPTQQTKLETSLLASAGVKVDAKK